MTQECQPRPKAGADLGGTSAWLCGRADPVQGKLGGTGYPHPLRSYRPEVSAKFHW